MSEPAVNAVALHNCVLAFDNVRAGPRRVSDALCRISTGAAMRLKTSAAGRAIIVAVCQDIEFTHIVPADPLTTIIENFIARRGEWTGTAAERLAALEFRSNAFIPGNARSLSYYLQRMWVDFRRSNGVRGIYLSKLGAANFSQAPVFAGPSATW